MFGRKRINKLVEDIDRYFDLMDRSVSVFKEGVRSYLYSDRNDFAANLQSMAMLENEVFPAFMVEMPALDKDEYTYDEFIAMVKANPDLAAVRVHKQRFGYMVNNTICEVGNVLINGAKVVTINSESTEIEDIKKTIADCGLEGAENINYLQAIKRVIGISDKPLANE